jgi:hypothetical protein
LNHRVVRLAFFHWMLDPLSFSRADVPEAAIIRASNP